MSMRIMGPNDCWTIKQLWKCRGNDACRVGNTKSSWSVRQMWKDLWREPILQLVVICDAAPKVNLQYFSHYFRVSPVQHAVKLLIISPTKISTIDEPYVFYMNCKSADFWPLITIFGCSTFENMPSFMILASWSRRADGSESITTWHWGPGESNKKS